MKRGRGGVQYVDLTVGDGPAAERGCTVEIRYSLWLDHGAQVQENQVLSFRLGARRVVAGLEYGVEGMRAGGERRIRVPPQLGYRDQGVPGMIPPNAAIEFLVVLCRVVPAGDTHG